MGRQIFTKPCYIAREIGRVHWNVYQEKWSRWGNDPKIDGIHWRQYVPECSCPSEIDDDGWDFYPQGHLGGCVHGTPHFQFEDVCFDWYKNPGRGMSVSKQMSEKEWVEWFDRCLKSIKAFECKKTVERQGLCYCTTCLNKKKK